MTERFNLPKLLEFLSYATLINAFSFSLVAGFSFGIFREISNIFEMAAAVLILLSAILYRLGTS